MPWFAISSTIGSQIGLIPLAADAETNVKVYNICTYDKNTKEGKLSLMFIRRGMFAMLSSSMSVENLYC